MLKNLSKCILSLLSLRSSKASSHKKEKEKSDKDDTSEFTGEEMLIDLQGEITVKGLKLRTENTMYNPLPNRQSQNEDEEDPDPTTVYRL